MQLCCGSAVCCYQANLTPINRLFFVCRIAAVRTPDWDRFKTSSGMATMRPRCDLSTDALRNQHFCEKSQRSGSPTGSRAIRRNSNSERSYVKSIGLGAGAGTFFANEASGRNRPGAATISWRLAKPTRNEVMSIGTVPPLAQWKRWIPTPPVMAAWGVLLLGFLWTYWETLFHVVRVWCSTPDYGHGFFVPIFAGFLLWQRQEMVDPWPNRGTWWGMPFFAVFALVRWFNLFLNYERDIDSLLPFLVGVTLVLGGWRALRWAWPSILFLIFMVPLPDSWPRPWAGSCNAWPPS